MGEGSANTDKGIIVMTSYSNLKLKDLTAPLFRFIPFFFLKLVVSNIYESVHRMDLYKHTYAATNSFHISFKRDDRRRELMKKRRVFLYLHETYRTHLTTSATSQQVSAAVCLSVCACCCRSQYSKQGFDAGSQVRCVSARHGQYIPLAACG